MMFKEYENNCCEPRQGYNNWGNWSRSSGVAKAGLATGIAGSTLGVLGAMGGLGSLVNNRNNNANCCHDGNVPCSENCFVNRYESQLIHENMLLTARAEHGEINAETDRKLLELYKYVVEKNEGVQHQLSDQRVVNEHNSCMISGLTEAMKRQRDEMYNLINREACDRNRADAHAIEYANCHFVPQTICGVKCDPDLAYRKNLSNPFDSCGCGCNVNGIPVNMSTPK